jgi:hypothetical protein
MARQAREARRTSKKAGIRIDLSKVGKAFEPGKEYSIKVVECTLEDGQRAPYFNMKLAGLEPEYESSFMYHKASTSESSLWRLRPLLEAFGMDVPDGPMDLSPDDFVGCTAMCTTYLDRWDGGSSVRPEDFFPLDGDVDMTDDEDEAEEEPAPKKRAAKAKEEEAEEEKPARKSRRSAKAEEPEDESEDEPAPKKRGAKKKSAGITEDELNEMNEDELEDLVEQHELDVELSDHKTLRKKRNAVLDALEEAGLLQD